MKTKFILNFAVLVMSLSSYSQIKIFAGGNINAGNTSTPITSSKMQIVGNTTFLQSNTTVTSSAHVRGNNAYSGATTPDYTWYNNDQTGFFHPASNVIGFTISGAERARITSNGNLLFGTATVENARINAVYSGSASIYCNSTFTSDYFPTVDVETNRSNAITYRGLLTGTGTTFYVAGAGWIYSQGNYLGSDKNIKDDIKKIDSASSKLSKINGVTYKLKKEKQNPGIYGIANEYMGVIAQDVEAVAPQAVKTFGDGTKGVCYEMLVGLLVEALKEQNAKITQLQTDVNNCCAKTGSTPQQNRTINNTNETSGDEYTGNSYIKQNVPNPFSKETLIEYFIAERNALSSILIFDMNGKLLKTFKLSVNGAGNLNIMGNELSPGMYYYSLIINNKEAGTKKMILTE